MPAETLITDPTLLQVLASATQARQQCLQLIDLLPQNTTTTDEPSLLAAKTLTAHLSLLRGLNRRAILAVRATKTQTTESRQEIDGLLLGLQNLYYEQGHLLGEIRGCEEAEHVYRTLPLVDEAEFRANREEQGESGLEDSGEDIMILRIRDEGERRRKLEDRRRELVGIKEGLVRETQGKKEELARLDAEVEKWISGANNIQKVFDGRTTKATTTASVATAGT